MVVPLLRLPENATRLVLQIMEVKDSLALSILSYKVRDLVRNTLYNIKPLIITVDVGRIITIKVSDLFLVQFYTVNKDRQCKMFTPRTAMVSSGNERRSQKWKNPKMKIKDWLDHLNHVFKQNKTDLMNFSPGFERFDFEALRRNIQSVKALKIPEGLSHEQSKMIFEKFFHIFEFPFLEGNVFGNREELRKSLLSSFDHLIYGRNERVTDFRLDDLLMINTRSIFLTGESLTEKELNRFLKLWMAGMSSNPCVLHLKYPSNRVIDKKEVLKGINYQEFEDDRVLTVSNHFGENDVKGGIDIHGKNGNKAVIQFKDSNKINIYVCY
ncbi:unnamed protein product [Caenorhabditis brenneri]